MSGEIILKVSEAKSRDVGRGIARIDPGDMKKIDASVGDIIEIRAKRGTVGKLMPSYPEDRGKDIIQIDGLIRENAQVSLDEKVSIRPIAFNYAEMVVLSPLTVMSAIRGDNDIKYIGRLLEGLPLTAGDRIRATLFGARGQDFTVVSTIPKGAVLIHPQTRIRIREEGTLKERGLKISYEDIGGLSKEIQRIREMIELPLKYPQVFERLGIEPPKGVLLHGPPGCGKTLIARAVANETEAYFTQLSGPEIMHKFYGESEAHLRGIFEEASRQAPAIIFLDEIDAIAPKREDMGGDRQLERRVVSQLLALMDGMKSRGQVIVIGATNIPDVLDSALRRPGRFDREIAISVPDKNARIDILQIHTRGMPLSEEVNLERLAEITHGFVGADLEALCREAAMVTLRKIMPKIEFDTDYIPYETLAELQVTMDNFLEALKDVDPSAIREVFTEIPDVKWNDVGGLADIKRILKETIEWPLKYTKLFEYSRTRPPKGILLYGPPGIGKTLLAKAVASESEVNFISIKGPALMSKYVGESERGVREVFKKAKQASPCIVFFDEIDALAPIRGRGDTQVTERVISQLLTELDGIEELKGVITLAATNRLDIVDPALLRPGRFDFLLELPIPEESTRLEIFKVHTRGKPLNKNVDLEVLAKEETVGLVGADIEAICRKAAMLAIREFIENKKVEDISDYSQFNIANKHFKEALKGHIKSK